MKKKKSLLSKLSPWIILFCVSVIAQSIFSWQYNETSILTTHLKDFSLAKYHFQITLYPKIIDGITVPFFILLLYFLYKKTKSGTFNVILLFPQTIFALCFFAVCKFVLAEYNIGVIEEQTIIMLCFSAIMFIFGILAPFRIFTLSGEKVTISLGIIFALFASIVVAGFYLGIVLLIFLSIGYLIGFAIAKVLKLKEKPRDEASIDKGDFLGAKYGGGGFSPPRIIIIGKVPFFLKKKRFSIKKF